MPESSYRPYVPARRPGGKPAEKPRYRVLVHRRYLEMWEKLPEIAGIAAAQQFYDHVANTPGRIPAVGSATILAGKAGKPAEEGFSRTIHYEITGAGRIDFQFNDSYRGGSRGEPHPVVRIRTIDLSSH